MIFLLANRLVITVLSFAMILLSIYLTRSASCQIDIATTESTFAFPTIIIDAGHGGIDSGTSANDGTPEKEINLSIAKKINETLTMMGYQTRMTRTDDELIGEGEYSTIHSEKLADITKRLEIVEEQENCILISVHQNYFQESKYSGFQAFYNNNNPQSQLLAQTLQNAVVTHLQPDNTRKIKTIGEEIYLLHHCTKPAVMVECGFMSNPKEVSMLKNVKYQSAIAYAIAKGIDDTLQQNPTFV